MYYPTSYFTDYSSHANLCHKFWKPCTFLQMLSVMNPVHLLNDDKWCNISLSHIYEGFPQ